MSERILQDALAKWLTDQGLAFFRQRMDKAATGTLGWPDFTIVHNGRVLLLETKFGKGKLSTAQVFKHAELDKSGCRVCIVRDLDSATELVTAWRGIEPYRTTVLGHENERLEKIGNALWRATPHGLVKIRNA